MTTKTCSVSSLLKFQFRTMCFHSVNQFQSSEQIPELVRAKTAIDHREWISWIVHPATMLTGTSHATAADPTHRTSMIAQACRILIHSSTQQLSITFVLLIPQARRRIQTKLLPAILTATRSASRVSGHWQTWQAKTQRTSRQISRPTLAIHITRHRARFSRHLPHEDYTRCIIPTCDQSSTETFTVPQPRTWRILTTQRSLNLINEPSERA